MDCKTSQLSKARKIRKKQWVGVAIAIRAIRVSAITTIHLLTFAPLSMSAPLAQLPLPQTQTPTEESPDTSDPNAESAPDSPEESPPTSNPLDGLLDFGANPSTIPQTPIYLDGRQLFSVALTESYRDNAIENQLKELLKKDLDAEQLQVFPALLNRLPVIYAKWSPQEDPISLLTVTTLDAELQGLPPETLAQQWSEQIRQALLRAEQERQPQYLLEQAFLGGAIACGTLVASLALLLVQRQLARKRNTIASETSPPETLPDIQAVPTSSSPEPNPVESESAIERQQTESISELQHKMSLRQQLNLNDLGRRVVQFTQVVVWGGGFYLIVGLFPYTRWIQPVMLSVLPLPLKLLVVLFGTYVGVRVSAVLIDRFFSALQDGTFLDADASRRVALRFSTFSAVFKSLSAATLIGIGILMAMGAIGIDLGPILAGAGIIGLGISLASQSLIKDTINGFLILFEDQFAVGDVIVVGDVGGLVENMNLRITQLRNGEGRLITIPNGAIAIVQNLSKEWARVDLTIEVSYDSNVDKVLAVLQELADDIYSQRQWREKIIDRPEVLGIDDIDHAGILIRIWIKTKPLQHWSVGREFRRRIKILLDDMQIDIGVPQQSVVFQSSLELLNNGRNGNGDRPQHLLSESSESEVK
ncbi:mechanosensitive ion channel family protein [Phormidium sp. CCY1219]|uniref:mechanosensitive ion channel family protein n=1 Tax=Phormidium sp. CCY1219 TaxID=2886104 RepID=UPI002D1F77E7|nr:mechanosensitive ion channel family protein [Phormidium sp. CCY1219]MEB3829976.1 mechanosensitive ion channel family protein [Phormidium sp. CCY1219]